MTRKAVFHDTGAFDDGSPIALFPGAVASVFGRTGAVAAVTGDYAGIVAAFLTGATQASRYVGATTSGAPASGTFAVGDFVIARDGHLFVCTAAGSPGTWADVGSASGVSSIAKTGSTALTGAVTLTGGTNVTLTQSGNDISIAAAGGSGYIGYVMLQDQKTASTEGGGYTTGAYATRVLNTEVSDTNNDCTLASNQFTLAAGTYLICASAPGFLIGRHRIRLRNTTDSATIFLGTAEYSASSTLSNRSFIFGQFAIAASKALEIQHVGDTTRATNGLGVAAQTSETEVYTVVELWRIS